MKKAIYLAILLFALTLIAPAPAPASRPVARTLKGCVINGALFTVHKSRHGAKPTVQRIKVHNFDLAPYEGSKIRVRGNLLPGDNFYPFPNSIKALGACDKASWNAIQEFGPQ